MDRDKALDSELTELQVQITSADPECDGYPSLKTDESCEFPFLAHAVKPTSQINRSDHFRKDSDLVVAVIHFL